MVNYTNNIRDASITCKPLFFANKTNIMWEYAN